LVHQEGKAALCLRDRDFQKKLGYFQCVVEEKAPSSGIHCIGLVAVAMAGSE